MAAEDRHFQLKSDEQRQLQQGVAALLKQQIVLQQRLREESQAAAAASESLYLDVLEVLDALEAMQNALERHPEPEPAVWKRLPRNLTSLQRKLAGILESRGVAPIVLGDGEPDYQAVRVIEREPAVEGERPGIRRVLRQGYRLGEAVLRPTEVVLAVDGD